MVYRVELDTGVVGWGDEHRGPEDVGWLRGQNPWSLLHDSRLGLGAQTALLDAVGKHAGVPVHALIGRRVRDRSPISWWTIDMSPEDWVAEARESIKRGHTTLKVKARPWRDIIAQIETVGKVVPADYRFDLDFNGFLLTPARAEVILHQLDDHPNVGVHESPFYCYRDLAGARLLRQRVRRPVVDHFSEDYLHAGAVDGTIISGTVDQVVQQAALAASFNCPFFLQMDGAGLTAALAVHLGSVLSHATLPYIACLELWEHNLLAERLEVRDGNILVPDGPGLGVEMDEAALERYRADPDEPTPRERFRARKRILRIRWPGSAGRPRERAFTHESAYQYEFSHGSIPGFEPGVTLEAEEDDGSPSFAREHARLAEREARLR